MAINDPKCTHCGDPGLMNPPLVSPCIADRSDCETEFSYGPNVGTQVPRLKDCGYSSKNVGILDHVSKYVADMGQWLGSCLGCKVTIENMQNPR